MPPRFQHKLSLPHDDDENKKKSLHCTIKNKAHSLNLGDVRDLVQSFKNCRKLSLEGFAFSIYNPRAFYEELRGAFDAFSSMETVTFEMPHESWNTESISALLQNVKKDLGIYITYSLNVKSDASIFVRFFMHSRRGKCGTAKLWEIGDSVGSTGPVVCYQTRETNLSLLPPHAHLVCDCMGLSTNDDLGEYRLDFLTAAVFDTALTGAKRVDQLTINMLFSGNERLDGDDLCAQWDNIAFVLSKCRNCKYASVTGARCKNMGLFLDKLHAFISGKDVPLFMYALFFEIHSPPSAFSEEAADKPLYMGTWRHKICNGNFWEQGFSRSSSGAILVWCLLFTKKRKRGAIDFIV